MYTLHISIRARREIKVISKLHKKAILIALRELKEEPFFGKPLTEELTKRYSLRVGLYRIIYTINQKDKIVSIISAGHRGTVYQ